jgi:uncharacterized repeat protein (TIGR03803 family)
VAYSFKDDGTDGSQPNAGLIVDEAGNLYGTTYFGGFHGNGTVFELTPTRDGGWEETLLHNFSGKDGAGPDANLVLDAVGNLYGTTLYGGSGPCSYNGLDGCGTVFELTPKAGGGWKEKVLHSFNGNDGYEPSSSLIFDRAGNLYGTTFVGGSYGAGTVFEITP